MTTYSFVDSPSGANAAGNSNAYLTQVIQPNTGTAHTENYQYDYVSGQLSQAQDQNGELTKYTYSDPMQRLTGVAYPDGGMKTISYSDVAPNPSVTTKTLINSNATLTQAVVFDGMRHSVQTQLQSDPSGQVNVDSTYNGMGGVYTVSNPHRSSESPALTTTLYDALGRKVKQTQPDSSLLQWCYNGVPSISQTNCIPNASSKSLNSWVDFSDENGNHWQRSYDGLGRMGSVMEPNASNAPARETDYTYNGLDLLINATQKGLSGESPRTRLFTYNSLGQLTSSSNPETGTVCYGTFSGGICQGNGYDANGNLAEKSDVRNVITSYSYDALNRITSKSYTNDPNSTPIACSQYDLSTQAGANANLIGRLANEWTQRATTVSCSAAIPSSALTSRSITAYDPMGRVLSEEQCTPNASGAGNCTSSSPDPFALAYVYDLAGNTAGYTNGVSNVPGVGSIAYGLQYDGAGRLQNLSSSWNPVAGPSGGSLSLFTADPTNGYTAFGAMQNIVLGDSIFVNKGYDNRLRPTTETATHP